MENRGTNLNKKNLIIAVLLIAVLSLVGVLVGAFATNDFIKVSAAESKKMMAFYDFKNGEGSLSDFTDSTGLNKTKLAGVNVGGKAANDSAKSKFGTSDAEGATDTSYYHWETSGAVLGGGGMTMTVDGQLPTYTIGLKFSLGHASKLYRYIRIMDFTNRESDNGFYYNYCDLKFYPFEPQPFAVADNEVVDLVISRNGETKGFYVYAIKDGIVSESPVYSRIDTNNDAVPKFVNGKTIFHLFNDGIKANTEFSPTGDVYSVKLWDSVLTRDEIVQSLKPTVTFVANGGTGDMGDQSNTFGESATLAKNTFIRGNNSKFIGWNTNADGSGIGYTDEQAYEFKESMTLYAMWEVIEVSNETTLCVSQNGNDISGDGTLKKPYQSITKAYAQAASGDVIYIIDDITPTFTKTGDLKAPIINFNQNKSVEIKGLLGTEKITRPSITDTDITTIALMSLSQGSLTLTDITVDGAAVWGEGGANIGVKNQGKILEVSNVGNLTLGSGVTLQNSAAGAVSGSGTSQITQNGATIKDCSTAIGAGVAVTNNAIFTMDSGIIEGCRASRYGGGIYAPETSTVILNSGTLRNNSATLGGGILANHALSLNPNKVEVANEIYWMPKDKSIVLLEAPTANANVFTINCSAPEKDKNYKVIDGDAADIGFNGATLKPYFKMALAGYTFDYVDSGLNDWTVAKGYDETALYVTATKTPVAALFNTDGSLMKAFTSLQAAIDDDDSVGKTIYFLKDTKADATVKLYQTINITDGKNITLKSGTVTVPDNEDDWTKFTYTISPDGSPVTLMRGTGFADEMFKIVGGGIPNARKYRA